MAPPTITCDDQILARWYRQLRHDGLTDAAIDQGYGQPQATADPHAPQRIVVGKGDQTITCAEIADTVFLHWQQYRHLIEKDLGRQVPWGLTGALGPQIQREVAAIRQVVAKSWAPGTAVYAQRLGYALYLYALLPRAERMPYFHTYQPDWLAHITSRLKLLGMGAIADRLMVSGGLGLGWFTKDLPMEGSALEAIAQQGGACTEKTKVLFTLFAEAGLTPFVYAMSVQQAMSAWSDLYQGSGITFQPTPDEESTYHVALGHADDANTTTSYDFQPFTANQELIGTDLEAHAQRITPREFMQIDLLNVALQQQSNEDTNGATATLRLARTLGASAVDVRIAAALAMIAMATDDRATAEREVATGLRALPNDPALRVMACDLGRAHETPQQTIKCLTPLAGDTIARERLAQLLIEQGQIEAALPDLDRMIQNGINRVNAALITGGYYLSHGDLTKAKTYFSQALQLAPLDSEVYTKVAVALASAKQWAEADVLFQRAARLETNPAGRSAIWRTSIPTQLALGRRQLAQHYLARASLAVRLLPPPVTEYLTLYAEFRTAAQLTNDWTHMAPAWAELTALPGLPGWVMALQIDLLWQTGQTDKALAAAKQLPIASRGFDGTPAANIDHDTIAGWGDALSLLPEPFWRAAPADLLDFFWTMGRWHAEWGDHARSRQTLQHYLRYATAPRPEAAKLLGTLKP